MRIPSFNPDYDPEWLTNKALFKQLEHMAEFARNQELEGCTVTPLSDGEKTPFLIVEITKSEDYKGSNCVLMYGHMDKQPYGEGWHTAPTDPVIKDGKLYGRGSSDDCYAFFSAILAVKAC